LGKQGVNAFYAVAIADMLVFATLIYFDYRECFNPAAHKAAHADRHDYYSGRGVCPLAHSCSVVGSPDSAYMLLRTPVVAGGIRPVVHSKASSRHALGECVSDRAPAGADADWANLDLAEFRHVRAESRPFFAVSAKINSARSSPFSERNGTASVQRIALFQSPKP